MVTVIELIMMIKNILKTGLLLVVASAFVACNGTRSESSETSEVSFADSARIVSINGTVSEILVDLGLENQIVGVDVASTYPASLQEKPKVGHSRQLTAEGVLALNPDVVISTTDDLKPEVKEQIENAGAKVLIFEHDYSVNGAKSLIRTLADSLEKSSQGDSIIAALENDLVKVDSLSRPNDKPSVLFIYARGAGTMMVAGEGTQLEKIIQLAGGENAVSGFSDFKPLTAEALVAANPDVILLFDSGLSSLGGADKLLEVPGVKETNAGRNKKIVEMDGQLLTGFSQRLGKAILELSEKIH